MRTLILLLIVTTAMLPAHASQYSPRDYGAAGDGETLDTAAIQQAIDAASEAGGGTVLLQSGRFLSGTLVLKDGVTLQIAGDAILLGSTNLDDYPRHVPELRSWTDRYTERSLLWAEHARDIALVGPGMIDFQGEAFEGGYKDRPYGIRFVTCQGVRVENIHLRNAAMWMQHYLGCEDVIHRGVRVWNHANKNNDAIDIDGCRNFLLEDFVSDTDDDGITIKTTSHRPNENLTIRNAVVSTFCNAVKFGTETIGDIRHVSIENVWVKPSAAEELTYGTKMGQSGLSIETVDGSILEDVTVRNMVIDGSQMAIFLRLGDRGRTPTEGEPRKSPGALRDVLIENVRARPSQPMGCSISGVTGAAIENLTLRNITLTHPGGGTEADIVRDFDEKREHYPTYNMLDHRHPGHGFFFWHVDGLTLENLRVTAESPDARPTYAFENVSRVTVDSEPMTPDKAADLRAYHFLESPPAPADGEPGEPQ
ncbi:MAG: glycoside hydrolase family 28 protein [Phycisphaeraceae bacterium]